MSARLVLKYFGCVGQVYAAGFIHYNALIEPWHEKNANDINLGSLTIDMAWMGSCLYRMINTCH